MVGYQHFGVMLDCSRNAVMKPEEVKAFSAILAEMGYDTLMLYTEDTFEVKDEPWFGYMRGRYTAEDIRDIEKYLKTLGMKLIPCVQTLAHFTNLCKLPHYADYFDVNDILLIDDEKTYELIDRIFSSLAQMFTSRVVHIGMDEAHLVGLGKYLDRHGFTDRTELLIKHLNKVCLIAKKYGFRSIMWSDMFFRLANQGEYYGKDIVFSEKVRELIPSDISLTYWDYYHREQEWYDSMFEAHTQLGREVWFAGGAWSWMGFAPMNGYSETTMTPAMKSVRKNGIKNVLITMWGDDGKECSIYALLPSLYEIACKARGEEDDDSIRDGFCRKFGIRFEDFMLLDLPNLRYAGERQVRNENLCKCLFYSDPFMGYFDASIDFTIDFAGYADKLRNVQKKGEFAYLFDLTEKLCDFLQLKYNLGVLTRQAYHEKDRNALMNLSGNVYPKAIERLKEFFTAFRALWLKENRPFGLEVHEARMGGLLLRLQMCAERLSEYANGTIERIDELEATLMPLSETRFLNHNLYEQLISFGKM